MKEFIEYNYNIIIDELIEGEDSSYFVYNKELYLFCVYKRDVKEVEDVINVSREIKGKNISSYDLIFNKDEKVLTLYDETYYALLKISLDYYEPVDIIDIISLNKKLKLSSSTLKENKNNWDTLWSLKVDYYEYQLNQLGSEKNILLESFSYFIGLAENAISMVNNININFNYGIEESIVLSHRRLYYPNYKLNYYNPISYIFDLEIRDVAEYIKSVFFKKEDAILELTTYLKSVKLTPYLYQMLYSRIVFPTYYFDLYDLVISDKSQQESLMMVIKNIDELEYFLKTVEDIISSYYPVERLAWLK